MHAGGAAGIYAIRGFSVVKISEAVGDYALRQPRFLLFSQSELLFSQFLTKVESDVLYWSHPERHAPGCMFSSLEENNGLCMAEKRERIANT